MLNVNKYYGKYISRHSGWFCIYCNSVYNHKWDAVSSHCPRCIKIARIVPMTIKEQEAFLTKLKVHFTEPYDSNCSLERVIELWAKRELF